MPRVSLDSLQESSHSHERGLHTEPYNTVRRVVCINPRRHAVDVGWENETIA
jgi:hypothetical protein